MPGLSTADELLAQIWSLLAGEQHPALQSKADAAERARRDQYEQSRRYHNR